MNPSAAQRPFHLLQVSDPHLCADPQTCYRGWCTDAALDAVLTQAMQDGQPIDALLLSGDLAQDESAAAYARLSEKLRALAVPVYALPGNHDDPPAMRRHLAGCQILGETQLGDWRMLLLDSRQPATDVGLLSEQELRRAADFLASLRQPGLIAVHHQPVAIGSAWMDSLGLENGSRLMTLAAQQPLLRSIVFGHVHQRYDARRRGIRLLGCPSTWRQFTPGAVKPQEDAAAQPGYRRLRLWPHGRLQTRILRLSERQIRGKEKSSKAR